MRELLYDAVGMAREEVGDLVQELRGERRLSDDEVLARYEGMRHDPVAIVRESFRRSKPGEDPLEQAVAFEREAGRLWRERTGRLPWGS